ncbi:hypothetical protein Gotri_026923, partial [Gossypium trilobum]|nr:hypothetical protein [Gossypium trilobum]
YHHSVIKEGRWSIGVSSEPLECSFKKPIEYLCVHLHEITKAAETEEPEATAECNNAIKEAIRGVQDAVTSINEHLEVRCEIVALEI